MRNLVVLTVALSLASGCYVGRTPTKKTAGYVVNGVGIALGAAIMLAGTQDSPSDCFDDCVGAGLGTGLGNMGAWFIGGNMVAAATAMMIVTMAVNVEPEPERLPTAQRSASAGIVTAPGLRPTTVQLR